MSLLSDRRQTILYLLVLLSLFWLVTACTLSPAPPGRPQITIQSPTAGEVVPINQPVIISAAATDPDGPGITSVEVFINNESVTTLDSPSGPLDVFDVATTVTPDTDGQIIITLIAYRRDGTPSAPATLVLEVVGLTVDPSLTIQPNSTADRGPTPTAGIVTVAAPTPGAGPAPATGRVRLLTNIRSGPGPFCNIIGFADEGDVINLLEYSSNELWIKTDFLDGRIGWIFVESLTILDNEDRIPTGTRLGCAGCGDGICNAGETCDDCPEDCGICCGNAVCDAQYGEDCGTCETDCGACCGNGVCEPGRNEDCGTCAADCGQCCGNGVCEAGRAETCDTCAADCGQCCGNGLCEAGYGEDCGTCAGDCGKCCGNGLCEGGRGETCDSCSADCGACTPAPTCGDGTCDAGEDSTSCPADCPPSPICGDGTCDAGEDSTSCPADCPPASVCGDGNCDSGEDNTSCPADCP